MKMSANRLRTVSALSVVSAILLLSACGGNPALVQKNKAPETQGGDAAQVAGAPAGDASKDAATPGSGSTVTPPANPPTAGVPAPPAPAAVPPTDNIATKLTVTEISLKPKPECVPPLPAPVRQVHVPIPAPVAVVADPGANGHDGAKGQDGCGPTPETLTIQGTQLSAAELTAFEDLLPYKSTRQHPFALLTLGQGNKNTGNASSIYAHNAQTVFTFSIKTLPPKAKVTKINTADLRMTLTKLSKDQFLATEMICFISSALAQSSCSGETISDPNWRENLNPNFFGGSPEKIMKNKKFSQSVLRNASGKVNGLQLFSGGVVLSLEELLKADAANATSITAMDFLYNTQPGTDAFTVIVADDTMVSADAQLIINMVVDTCQK